MGTNTCLCLDDSPCCLVFDGTGMLLNSFTSLTLSAERGQVHEAAVGHASGQLDKTKNGDLQVVCHGRGGARPLRFTVQRDGLHQVVHGRTCNQGLQGLRGGSQGAQQCTGSAQQPFSNLSDLKFRHFLN